MVIKLSYNNNNNYYRLYYLHEFNKILFNNFKIYSKTAFIKILTRM